MSSFWLHCSFVSVSLNDYLLDPLLYSVGNIRTRQNVGVTEIASYEVELRKKISRLIHVATHSKKQ